MVIGPKIYTTGAIIGETRSAARSGSFIAYIFGITSAKITISSVITNVE